MEYLSSSFIGRIKRIKSWKEIQNEVLKALSKKTVTLFLIYFYEMCQKKIENKENIPCIIK